MTWEFFFCGPSRTGLACARAARRAPRRRRYQPPHGRAVQRARGRAGPRVARNVRGRRARRARRTGPL